MLTGDFSSTHFGFLFTSQIINRVKGYMHKKWLSICLIYTVWRLARVKGSKINRLNTIFASVIEIERIIYECNERTHTRI